MQGGLWPITVVHPLAAMRDALEAAALFEADVIRRCAMVGLGPPYGCVACVLALRITARTSSRSVWREIATAPSRSACSRSSTVTS